MTYLELCENALRDLEHSKITLGEFEERIKPLKQELKTGHWIDTEHYKSYDDGDVITTQLKCSHCKDIVEWDTESPHKPYYRENCGAKMIDPQESEKKE